MTSQPSPDVEAEPTDDERAAMEQFMRSMRGPSSWTPVCVVCLNAHKLAIGQLGDALTKAGIQPGSQEWANAFSVSFQFGELLAQQPNTEVPTGQLVIPAVRPAVTIINGSAVCAICFVPQGQQSSLLTPATSASPFRRA